MHTAVAPANEESSILKAVDVLREGGLVAFPTDTVYGLGALAFRQGAVRRIFLAKKRAAEKSVPVLVAGIADCRAVASELKPMARVLAARFWPGPLTLVMTRHPDLPSAVASGSTVGVRQPNHPVAMELLRRAGPLAVTSANMSGEASPRTPTDVLGQLDGRIDLILDGGPTPGGIPSTVVDCTGSTPVVLRDGPVALPEIMAALKYPTGNNERD